MLTEHKANECNEAIDIEPMAPSVATDCPEYSITWKSPAGVLVGELVLSFQHGPIAEVGTNGITNEALLAIILDRLRRFQAGAYKCRENAVAITKLEEGLMWLQKRTREREQRGVEGTSTP
jgi:hypothetical protein